MKPAASNNIQNAPVRFLAILCFASCFMSQVSAQLAPTLGLHLYPALSITGKVGALYAIQATSDPAQSNGWSPIALVQLTTNNLVWTDASSPANIGARFYRAILAATNLTYILPGTFTMGSPTNEALRGSDESQHVVTISRGFWIGSYLISQADYLSVVGNNPSFFTPGNGYLADMNRPVESVLWSDATNYCALRTRQERAAGLLPATYVYRLPTEAEWEYACRAGTSTASYFGNTIHSGQANCDGQHEYDFVSGTVFNAKGVNLQQTTPVGSYPPNGWGLFDMAGNVWEWCQDWYGPYQDGNATDPQGAASGPYRVVRGGGCLNYALACRSAQRDNSGKPPGSFIQYKTIGFRVVLAPENL